LMPTYIARSGYCCVSHDIQPDGRVSNVAATYCTDAHLKPYAKKSVERYVFEPERKDGTPVTAKSLTIKLAWHIVDDFGQTVVGGNGFMTPRPDGSHDTEMIFSAEIA